MGCESISNSTLSLFHKTLTRILFSLLFQVQSNLLAMTVPFSLVKILIYSIFISVTHISAKIPFKDHLPYYLNQNFAYLLGLNFLHSTLLHLSRFPIFTGLQWIFLCFFLMNSISREPPRITKSPEKVGDKLGVVYSVLVGRQDARLEYERDSYKEHLKVAYERYVIALRTSSRTRATRRNVCRATAT